MRIVLFTHPPFFNHQSMPRFTNMLAEGMRKRGHEVEIYSPEAFFFNLPLSSLFKKWLGYIDQLFIFPAIVKKRIKYNHNTLYIFTDHALSMWVPIVKHLPYVIICHDFLAQRSANGEIPQNLTGWTGRKYQGFIRKGYTLGENFISVSKKTQQDLHKFLGREPALSRVVYNGLNNDFVFMDIKTARQILNQKTKIDTFKGYILHVGGNLWYKNMSGVIKIYNSWRGSYCNSMPLLLIGSAHGADLQVEIKNSPYGDSIHLLSDIDDEYMNAAYSGASVLLFPSYAEGFGWPIAEAMASGCIVITTNEAPMTEVGGDAAVYISTRPISNSEDEAWAMKAAKILNQVINLPDSDRLEMLAKGYDNSKRFNRDNAMNQLEKIFFEILI